MLTKNQINRNKTDDKAKADKKTLILCHLYKTISMDILSLSDRSKSISVIKPLRTVDFDSFAVRKMTH